MFKEDIISINYLHIQYCPLCGGKGVKIDELTSGKYSFNGVLIAFPESDNKMIPVMKCNVCGLIYKFYLPAPDDLKEIYDKYASRVWKQKDIAYTQEKEIITKFTGKRKDIDLIDIGSGSGSFLKAINNITGRRSALDITRNSYCEPLVNDEYIEAFIESGFSWSGNGYDVVTAFDIIEHLYKPKEAFDNILRLLKPGGILIVQTGNPDFSEGDYNRWWYLNLFEHHICWPESTLNYLAEKYDISLIYLKPSQHKNIRYSSLTKKILLRILHILKHISLFRKLVFKIFKKDIYLFSSGATDHINVVYKCR